MYIRSVENVLKPEEKENPLIEENEEEEEEVLKVKVS